MIYHIGLCMQHSVCAFSCQCTTWSVFHFWCQQIIFSFKEISILLHFPLSTPPISLRRQLYVYDYHESLHHIFGNGLWFVVKTQGCQFLHWNTRAGMIGHACLMHFFFWRTVWGTQSKCILMLRMYVRCLLNFHTLVSPNTAQASTGSLRQAFLMSDVPFISDGSTNQ